MKLYRQLLLFMLTATIVPLVLGLISMALNEARVGEQILEQRREAALRLAERAGRDVMDVVERVQKALGYAELGRMTPEELRGLLAIVYKQSEDIVQVSLVDQSGLPVVPGLYLEEPSRYPEYVGRLAVSAEQHAAFEKRLPWRQAAEAPAGSAVIGAPVVQPGAALLALPLAIPVSTGAQAPGRWTAGVELSLGGLSERLQAAAGLRGLTAALVDEDGRLLAHPDSQRVLARSSLADSPGFLALRGGPRSGALVADEAVHAYARVEPLGWALLLTQPRDVGWAEIRAIRASTLGWTGLSILGLATLGWGFSRRITRDLRAFELGAEAFARGDLATRIEAHGSAELELLAGTFNRMGSELQASRAEIEAWNRELAARVEARTRELELAQRRLLETGKLAAIGQLGAGVAHEINNPLVGILGNVQLLLLKLPEGDPRREALQKIERSAKRTREVVQNLLRFSEADADGEHMPCDLHKVMEDALSLTQERLLAQGIRVRWERAERLPRLLGAPRQLMQVFLNLVDNARVAMPQGGELCLATRATEEGVLAEVRDTGRGIPAENLKRIFEPFFTTKDVWTNTGLGLSVAYRIVAEHGGRIDVESEVGRGSAFRVVFPKMEGGDA
ncbi:MAG TPA: ATP-binding protein [Myxococcota bacterium]|nr:ATP-binding protein [Myxococcota bacterium]